MKRGEVGSRRKRKARKEEGGRGRKREEEGGRGRKRGGRQRKFSGERVSKVTFKHLPQELISKVSESKGNLSSFLNLKTHQVVNRWFWWLISHFFVSINPL